MQLNIFKKDFWKGQRLLLLAFLVLHTFVTLVYLKDQPLTNDEADYIEYSKRWLKGNPLRVVDVDDSKTPIVAVAWIPRVIKQFRNKDLQKNDWGRSDQVAGRYLMIIFFWGVFLYTWLWAKTLYGEGWVIPVVLLVIDPLFMAFSPIVTSDMACVLMLLASMYHAYKYSSRAGAKHFWLMAIFSGLALVTKLSLIFLPFILLIVFLIKYASGKKDKRRQVVFIRQFLLFILICWLIVNAGFYFYSTFLSWESYQFKSRAFTGIIDKLSFIKPLPRLLPEPFIQGFDLLQHHKELGPEHPDLPFKGVFIIGKKYPHGVWFYYLLTGLLKVPIGIIVLLIITIFYFFKRFNLTAFINKYQFLAVPVIVYGFIVSFLNPFQQGLRHAMILFPFFYLGIGYVWSYFSRFHSKGRFIIYGCILYSFISTAIAFPGIMHYSNELIIDKRNVFKYIAEFNYRHDNIKIDCQPFLNKNSGYQLAPTIPSAGKFIVPGAFVYNTTYEVYKNYKWLKQFEPVGVYRQVFLLFDISKKDFEAAIKPGK